MKKVLNRKQSENWQRIKALQLLHCCLMLSNSPGFVLYVEGKLLNKLKNLVKSANKSDLGKRLIGRAGTEESALFLTMLVCVIKIWGTSFQKYRDIHCLNQDNKEVSDVGGDSQNATEFNAVYCQLVKENVAFLSCPELFKLVA